MKPLIITTGEPSGIGPDICIQLADYLAQAPVVLCGDIELLRLRTQLHQKNIHFYHYGKEDKQSEDKLLSDIPSLAVHHTPCFAPVELGKLAVKNAQYVLNTLTIAAQNTLNGTYSGIVTAPIHKGVICETGTHFSGHTEFFAEITDAKLPVMVLGNQNLKVGLVTTHLPLKDISKAITRELLIDILTIVDHDMRKYFTQGKTPRIGVCGLNPHAGESGHMGREEIEVINPTLNYLRKQGLNVSPALPADTIFVPHNANQYDIIVAMYHDQGLPVIKSQGFGECVNMTFGLPIIRTSVDHGTALDLAGTGKADPNSLKCAVEYAITMSQG